MCLLTFRVLPYAFELYVIAERLLSDRESQQGLASRREVATSRDLISRERCFRSSSRIFPRVSCSFLSRSYSTPGFNLKNICRRVTRGDIWETLLKVSFCISWLANKWVEGDARDTFRVLIFYATRTIAQINANIERARCLWLCRFCVTCNCRNPCHEQRDVAALYTLGLMQLCGTKRALSSLLYIRYANYALLNIHY